MKDDQYISAASKAISEGDFMSAISYYQLAKINRPEFAEAYSFVVQRLHNKLGNLGKPFVDLGTLSRQASRAAARLPQTHCSKRPMASVIMTTHNVTKYLEESVTSILYQSWRNLELVVVDDASTDGTWEMLLRLAQSDSRLCIRRLNANLGTYYAKNLGLTIARGAFVFFQDGDDICHPERLRLGMDLLLKPGVIAVQGAYSRVEFPSTRVLPINGELFKPGLITLGIRREVFEAIGMFNCTTKASDDEFFQRLKAYSQSGAGEIAQLDLPTYYNTFRVGSLFNDMVTNNPVVSGVIEQRPSPSRAAYVKSFQAKHAEIGVNGFRDFFTYPVLRDHLPVDIDMTLLPNPSEPVHLSLCSIPERVEQLEQVITALAPQVDQIHLYLDRYPEAPAFLHSWETKLEVLLSKTHPGLRDNGKFLPLDSISKNPCWLITVDDDIAYPPDYVAALIKRLEYYDRQVVLGVHGVLLPEKPEGYFSARYRKVHNFTKALEKDALVNVIGTGTMACHNSILEGLSLSHFAEAGMADLYLASWCKQNKIPMIAIARHAGWLEELGSSSENSLWAEFSQADMDQAALVRANGPWGYTAIKNSVEMTSARAHARNLKSQLPQRLEALIPMLWPCLW